MNDRPTDFTMHVCIVKYPYKNHASFGSNGDRESAMHRLADHSGLYGADLATFGYVINCDTRKVVAEFKGGVYRDGAARSFCPKCEKTVPKFDDRSSWCPACRAENGLEIDGSEGVRAGDPAPTEGHGRRAVSRTSTGGRPASS